MKRNTVVLDKEHWVKPDQWEEYLLSDILIPFRMGESTEDVWKSGFVEGRLMSVIHADFKCHEDSKDMEVFPILVVYDKKDKRIYRISASQKSCRCLGVTNI